MLYRDVVYFPNIALCMNVRSYVESNIYYEFKGPQ